MPDGHLDFAAEPEPNGGPNIALRDVLAATSERLRGAGVEAPERQARRLICGVLDLTPEVAIAALERAVTPDDHKRVETAASRLAGGEPLNRVLGRADFYGRSFVVTPDVLDPRPDTETLVDAALTNRPRWASRASPRVLDIGTGSGCLLATMLAEMPDAKGLGVDISQAACAVARRNLKRLGLSDRGEVVYHDARRALTNGQRYNLVVSNPPYISREEMRGLPSAVADYDPTVALMGGDDGLDLYRAILGWVSQVMADDAALLFEVGHRQAVDVLEMVRSSPLLRRGGDASVVKDLAGRDRCVAVWTRSDRG